MRLDPGCPPPDQAALWLQWGQQKTSAPRRHPENSHTDAKRALYALDYTRPASSVYESAAMRRYHSRLVEEFPSYFNVSKNAPNAEMILELFKNGLLIARASEDEAELRRALARFQCCAF